MNQSDEDDETPDVVGDSSDKSSYTMQLQLAKHILQLINLILKRGEDND